MLDRFEKPITLRLYKDDSELSYEDEKLLKELASLSDKVSYEMKTLSRDWNTPSPLSETTAQKQVSTSTAFPGA